jgi:aspartate aminotransferase/aminotransferase
VILDEANKFEDVIRLEIGQPDLPTPKHIIEAATQAAYEGYTGYTPNAGYYTLREAFAARLFYDHRIEVSPEQVVVSAGAMGALFDAFCAIVAPGDEILVPDPGYPNYYMPINLLGARAVPYPLDIDHGFALKVDAIRPLITDRTKAVILNSPSNPTGSVASRKELVRIMELAEEKGVFIFSDEAYDHIIFDGEHISPLEYDHLGQVIGIYSCSKTYSMTGWRIGFIVTKPELSPLMAKLQEMYMSCAPSISQKAAEAALTGPQDCVQEMVNIYQHRVMFAADLCQNLKLKCVVPQGAFYMMIELPEEFKHDSMDCALRLVREAGVAFAPGITFGQRGEGYIRASLCSNEKTISEGLHRLAAFFS